MVYYVGTILCHNSHILGKICFVAGITTPNTSMMDALGDYEMLAFKRMTARYNNSARYTLRYTQAERRQYCCQII